MKLITLFAMSLTAALAARAAGAKVSAADAAKLGRETDVYVQTQIVCKPTRKEAEEYYRYFNALAAFRSPALRARTMELALSKEVRTQDTSILLAQLLTSRSGQDEAWAYIKGHWPAVVDKVGSFQGMPTLAGALAALGATLLPGFTVVSEENGFDDAIGECNLVITGEGALDAQSGMGKGVGRVAERAREAGVTIAAVCGRIDPGAARALGLAAWATLDGHGPHAEQILRAVATVLARE